MGAENRRIADASSNTVLAEAESHTDGDIDEQRIYTWENWRKDLAKKDITFPEMEYLLKKYLQELLSQLH